MWEYGIFLGKRTIIADYGQFVAQHESVRPTFWSASGVSTAVNALYKLAQQFLAMEPEMAMGKKVLEPFRAAFDARAACLYDAGTGDLHLVGDSRNSLADRTREGYILVRTWTKRLPGSRFDAFAPRAGRSGPWGSKV